MKVTKISTNQQSQKTSCIKNIKDFFCVRRYGLKLRTLAEDVFDRILPYGLDGPRKLSNSVSDPIEEYCYTIGKRIKFSKKDERKLRQLEGIEYLEFSTRLIEDKRFTIIE